jgi:hypothetical protein
LGLLALPLGASALIYMASTAANPATAGAATVAKADKDCSDFSTQEEAQRFFESHHPNRDPHRLDADNDGKACEDLPSGVKKFKLHGHIKGVPMTPVTVAVKTDDRGRVRQVIAMKFRGVPVTCSDTSSGAINGNMPTMRVRRNNFAAKTSIEGTGIESGVVRVSGKFRRGGRVVKGDVRFTFEVKSGASCTTGKRRYKATK